MGRIGVQKVLCFVLTAVLIAMTAGCAMLNGSDSQGTGGSGSGNGGSNNGGGGSSGGGGSTGGGGTSGGGGSTGGGGTTGNTAGITNVNHIIFMAQENRSFDHYFGKLNDYRRSQGLGADVDGLPDDCSATNSDWTVKCSAMNMSPDANGNPTTPIFAFHLKTSCIENTSADWIVSHWAFNAESPSSNTPLMDGFVIGAASAARSTGSNDTAGIRAMGFYTAADLPFHYWLATQFATSDRWFSPAPTKTEPNRYFMVGATSAGHAYPVKGTTINAKTIFDELTAANISWKIYIQSNSTSATAFSGFASRNGANIVPLSQFDTDIANGTLPTVAYIDNPDADEHPGLGDNIQTGVQLTQHLVNEVMNSSIWKSSVFILTFDEAGGLFDHVAPPTNVPNPDGIQPVDICTSSSDPRCATASLTHTPPPFDPDGDFTRYGFRVPLMVISPFTKPHFVSHTVTDYLAWMKFVETRFNLKPLTLRDAFASDMTEFFDFQNSPLATPPANPPSDGSGDCHDGLP
jgi:phospholipase C